MNPPSPRPAFRPLPVAVLSCLAALHLIHSASGAGINVAVWRPLPLVTGGKIDPAWVHLGWGGFVVDNGTLRTECEAKGLGLLVYQKERLGNCQLRIVFRQQEPKCNSGVYVRIADGILDQTKNPGAAFSRDANGRPSEESMTKMKASSENEDGPWFAVHRGFEVQIADGGADPQHRTGSIYSLAASSPAPPPADGAWRTMIITLDHDKISVEVDGKRVSQFDSSDRNAPPPRKQWHEPKREPKRPQVGYFGLQNHDPGDVVWFKEVSVRPLPASDSTTDAK